jgi:predicted protein tyrosine phosphatase
MKVKVQRIQCYSYSWFKTISYPHEGLLIKDEVLKLFSELNNYCFSMGFLWLMGELEALKVLAMMRAIEALQKDHTDNLRTANSSRGLKKHQSNQEKTQKSYLPESYKLKYNVEEEVTIIQNQTSFEREVRDNKNIMVILIAQDGIAQRKHALTIRDKQSEGIQLLDTKDCNSPFKPFSEGNIKPVIDYLNNEITELQNHFGNDNLYIRVVKYVRSKPIHKIIDIPVSYPHERLLVKDEVLKLFYKLNKHCFSIGFLWLMGELESFSPLDMMRAIKVLQKDHMDNLRTANTSKGLKKHQGNQEKAQKSYLPESYKLKYNVEEEVIVIQNQTTFEREVRGNQNIMVILIAQNGKTQKKRVFTIQDRQSDGIQLLDTKDFDNPFKLFSEGNIKPVIDYLNNEITGLQTDFGKDNLYIRVVKYVRSKQKRKLTDISS